MHFEGITLFGVINELRERIGGGYIQKIHQPTPEILILQIYNRDQNRLLISSGQAARIHLTEQKYENPETPYGFCMLLRKHLMGAHVTEIDPVGLERICNLKLNTKTDEFVLRAEFMGTQSNIILLKKDRILGAQHAKLGHRAYKPGDLYEQTHPSGKLNPFEFGDTAFDQSMMEQSQEPLERAIRLTLDGIGPQTAKELCERAKFEPDVIVETLSPTDVLSIANIARDLFSAISTNPTHACLYHPGGRISECTLQPYKIYQELEPEFYSSISLALDQVFAGTHQEPLEDEVHSARKDIQSKIKRVKRALKATERDLERAKEYESIKSKGDLIMANLSLISKGLNEIELQDYEGNVENIQLDPKLTPVENAQALYKRYKKLKRGVDKIIARISELESELQDLEQLQNKIEMAESLDTVRDLEIQVELGGDVLDEGSVVNTAPTTSGPRLIEYKGYRIWVGRNGKQNDALIKKGQREDLWFHVKDRPGSHVLIQAQRSQDLPQDVIVRGAELAAFYSKAKNEPKVDVLYTRIKHLKKPKGARPGQVLVSKQEGTITVKPRGE